MTVMAIASKFTEVVCTNCGQQVEADPSNRNEQCYFCHGFVFADHVGADVTFPEMVPSTKPNGKRKYNKKSSYWMKVEPAVSVNTIDRKPVESSGTPNLTKPEIDPVKLANPEILAAEFRGYRQAVKDMFGGS